MRRLALGCTLLCVALVVGCQSEGGANGSVSQDKAAMRTAGPMPPLTVAQLRAVPTDAAFTAPIEVSVFAWRDMMPSDQAPNGLIVSAQIRGGVSPPKPLRCDGMYLVFQDTVHAARPSEVRDGDGPGAVECIVRNAPAWPSGRTIQVILAITSPTGQSLLVRRETAIEEVH